MRTHWLTPIIVIISRLLSIYQSFKLAHHQGAGEIDLESVEAYFNA